MKTRNPAKSKLIEKLKAANESWRWNMEALSKVATNHGILLEAEEPLLEHGWLANSSPDRCNVRENFLGMGSHNLNSL